MATKRLFEGIVQGFADSWNTPGMPGFGDLFAEDADFVVITGRWFRGRDDIVNYHRKLLARFYKGSRLRADKVWVRLLSPTVAVAHVTWKSWYMADGKREDQSALMSLVLMKSEGKWKIEAAHNTLTGGPRYAFHRQQNATGK